jgi:hypothetical protein
MIIALDINKYMDGWSDNGYRIPSMKRVINATLFRYFGALRDARKSASQDIIVQNTSDLETCQGHEGAKRLSEEGSKKPVLPDRDWEELIRHCSTVRPIMADASNAAVAGPSVSIILKDR